MLRASAVATSLTIAATLSGAAAPRSADVEVLRLPERMIKPRAALGTDGTLHLVVYSGGLQQGNLLYLRRPPGQDELSPPTRINLQPRSVNGRGSIASPHLALGKADRVHVAYPGSRDSTPLGPYDSPGIFYSRQGEDGAFEAPRNIMRRSRGGQFGGQSIAADAAGNVWVSWYGVDGPRGTEPDARLFVARSNDEGLTFAPERLAREEKLGACYCCAMSAMAADDGRLLLFYRAAGDGRHRDMHLFSSVDGGTTFEDLLLDRWEFVGCPETGGSLVMALDTPLALWEAAGKLVKVARLPLAEPQPEVTVLRGDGKLPRYPVAATNTRGETLIVWVEGVSAKRPGSVVWQLLDSTGRPVGKRIRRDGAKANSLVAVVARPDGSFLVVL